MNETTKLHKLDTTSSYDEFLRYVQPYKLILTTSTTHLVNNETPNLYSKGATLSIFIHEGRPTTTKLTLVDLPSSTNHSSFHECSKGILCLAPTFLHSPVERTRYRRYLLLAGRPKGNPHRRDQFTQLQRVARPSKLVSNLPTPLSNHRKSYLYGLLHLH